VLHTQEAAPPARITNQLPSGQELLARLQDGRPVWFDDGRVITTPRFFIPSYSIKLMQFMSFRATKERNDVKITNCVTHIKFNSMKEKTNKWHVV
jgi:hypothetical protein